MLVLRPRDPRARQPPGRASGNRGTPLPPVIGGFAAAPPERRLTPMPRVPIRAYTDYLTGDRLAWIGHGNTAQPARPAAPRGRRRARLLLVMAGLVPLLSSLSRDGLRSRGRHCRRPLELRCAPHRHARTCSTGVRFNFGTGSTPTRETISALLLSPRTCSGVQACPGPRSGETGRERSLTAWTPEQVRGDSGGQKRKARACRNPCPDPAHGPVTRFHQRLAPGPAHLNPTAMEQVRASTPGHRLVPSRLAPRCSKT